MSPTIKDLAAALSMPFEGDGDLPVGRASDPATAGQEALAVALSPAFSEALHAGHARAAILWAGADWRGFGLCAAILAPPARLTLARIAGALDPDDMLPHRTSSHALIDPAARIGDGCAIGPFTTIAAGAEVGPGARIGARVTIGPGARIGAGARIHDGAWIGPRVIAGAHLVMQPGAVVGSDGYSFVTATPSNPERAKATGGAVRLDPPEDPAWHKTMSLGAVILGDEVEIGANSTVDAGTLKPTRIGTGTKLDNLVHVGHNVEVGAHCLLCGQTGIAGSVVIGDRTVLGGQTGVGDHNRIGSDVVTGAGTMIQSNVPSGSVLLGYPSQRMDRAVALFRTLKRMGRDAATPSKAVPKDGGRR